MLCYVILYYLNIYIYTGILAWIMDAGNMGDFVQTWYAFKTIASQNPWIHRPISDSDPCAQGISVQSS